MNSIHELSLAYGIQLKLFKKIWIGNCIGFNTDRTGIDIQLCKNDVLVLYRDDQLESMTECDGCIHNKTYEELKECKYQHSIQNLFSDEKIITLH